MLNFGDVIGIIFILFFFFLFRWGFRLMFALAVAGAFRRKTGDFLKNKFGGDDENA